MPIIDCPALHERAEDYPFGDRVPKRVRVLRLVHTDIVPGFPVREFSHIPADAVLPAWTNSYGAVCAVITETMKLGLRPGEFEVVEWHDSHFTDMRAAAALLAVHLKDVADQVANGDHDEWKNAWDLLEATLNNVRHDFGESMGDSSLFLSGSR